MNFSISLKSFENHFSGLQNLLAVAISCFNQTQFLFCSSTASVSAQMSPILERVSSNPTDANSLGYSRSKWVAEAICDAASQTPGMSGRVSILRIGQLTGDTVNGIWNMSEAWPLMLSTVDTLGCLPRLEEKLSWLPMDIAAKAVLDIAFQMTRTDDTCLVYHVVSNDTTSDWMDLLGWIQKKGARFNIEFLNVWLEKLDREPSHPAKSLSELWKDRNEGSKMVYDTFYASMASESLRSFVSIDEEFVGRIWDWIQTQSIS